MHDEFLYIAKARPGPPLVTGSVRHASRAAGGAVKHLLHSHLSAGTGSLSLASPNFVMTLQLSGLSPGAFRCHHPLQAMSALLIQLSRCQWRFRKSTA